MGALLFWPHLHHLSVALCLTAHHLFRSPLVSPTLDASSSSSTTLNQTLFVSNNLRLCLLNAQSVCKDGKADAISDFILENNLDIVVITESWLRPMGDEPIIVKLTPDGYRCASFPRPSRGGGIAIVYKDCLSSQLSFSQALPFAHPSFEFVEATAQIPGKSVVIFSCIYRPPPSTQNKLTNSMFFSNFDSLLDHYSIRPGRLILLGDFNFHFDKPDHPDTKRLCASLSNHNLSQHVTQPTHRLGHTLDWIISRSPDKLVLDTNISSVPPSDHYAVLVSLSLPPPTKTKRLVTRRNLKGVNLDGFCAEAADLLSNPPSSDLASHFDSSLRQLVDKHAPATKCSMPDHPCSLAHPRDRSCQA